ncbi:hypothetical protein NLJ89_g1842 [Agrocybe chaxingu]|uniref:F-box domain-containing protein n=1 Tax=Agrocybe chaxingu TaxID=84603 RepID=A0A9W8TCQ5_9AGAR|nr:hypothetical protein NLJ89_g1842 [Agrocybe chaxingu]
MTRFLNFDNLSDELILCIFSHLSFGDLCITQPANRNWARLAGDNELWRSLYLQVYGRTRLRGAKGFISRLDGREVKPLPGRAKSAEYKDWKWMFRISSNWKRGRCSVEEPEESLMDVQSALHSSTLNSHVIGDGGEHIILAGPLTITASPKLFEKPPISIIDQHYRKHTLICEPAEPGPVQITTLALDQSPPLHGHLSLACFLSTGEFAIFEFNATATSHFSRKFSYRPTRRSSRTSNIIRAAYYHPLVVTLANSFSLSIYDLSSGTVRHTQTLSAFTSYPPASLVLSSPSATQFKLVIVYSSPVYPRHWSVGATELLISRNPPSATPALAMTPSSHLFTEEFRYPLPSTMTVTATRNIRAFDVPNGWIDTGALQSMREQWSRKVFNVAAAQTDGKWVVLAPGDNLDAACGRSFWTFPPGVASSALHSPVGLQLYRLVLPTQSNSISASPPKLNFVRTLVGQTSPVSALAVADGRCVSLGGNGGIWVWDLEGGTGAEVASADETFTDPGLQSIRGTISFDERRIVSAHAGKVVIRRFDI